MIKAVRTTLAALAFAAATTLAVSSASAISVSTDCWNMDDVGLVCLNIVIMDDGTAYYSGGVMR